MPGVPDGPLISIDDVPRDMDALVNGRFNGAKKAVASSEFKLLS